MGKRPRDAGADRLIARIQAGEDRIRARRRKTISKAISTYVGRMADGDLKTLEDALYPIVGRLELIGE